MTCIYCPSTGPFTDEHVVPAGLGGDDKDWLLKDVVCGVCNTTIFSPLETKVMRSSPLAIARLFLQSRSRNRGGKTTAPSIQAPVSYFDDAETGLLLEQELRGRGQPTVFPQVIVVPPNQVTVTATDVPSANQLVDELGSLPDLLTICVKERDGPEVRFHLSPLTWQNNRYSVGEAAGQAKAPRDVIWLEPLELPATNPAATLTPRVFRRTNGPLVCRAGSVDDAARLLTFIRTNHSDLIVPAGTPATSTVTPGIHFRQLMDAAAYDRVLTKIGINLCAHLFGPDAVRTAAFDAARDYARTGDGGVRRWPIEVAKASTDRFPRLPNHHLMVVTVNPPSAEQAGHVAVLMQFYGGPIEALIVAEGDTGIPDCPDPIFVVVDYEANVISKFSMEEFAIFAIASQASIPFFDPEPSGNA
ncbi:MAG: hypothetical protein QOJ27_329 [Sphingomonadales bacterium]|nr:hypothetical protein [Sphingomonadales bacterium]